jgi:hypothetical protein
MVLYLNVHLEKFAMIGFRRMEEKVDEAIPGWINLLIEEFFSNLIKIFSENYKKLFAFSNRADCK